MADNRVLTLRQPDAQSFGLSNLVAHAGSLCRFGAPVTLQLSEVTHMNRLVAFDLETAKILPESVKDLMEHRPLGIACGGKIGDAHEIMRFYLSMFVIGSFP